MEPINQTVFSVVEAAQEAIIDSGGRFFKQKEIKEMTVEEFLLTIIPNNIDITINWVKTTKVQ